MADRVTNGRNYNFSQCQLVLDNILLQEIHDHIKIALYFTQVVCLMKQLSLTIEEISKGQYETVSVH